MIRIAGAQIPVTDTMEENVKHIKTAIDWANKNNVDMLLTPEGSLSGYIAYSFEQLESSNLEELEKEVVAYAYSNNVSLALGTESIKKIDCGRVKCSQIKYYTDSILVGEYDKQLAIPAEHAYPGKGPEIISFEGFGRHGHYQFKGGSFICNDMWGQLDSKQVNVSDMFLYANSGVNIIFHASNGFRGPEAGDEESNRKIKEFADINLWMTSRFGIPIITVDNCYKNNGKFYDGPTSSTSGIIHNGEWLVKAAPLGTDYFYYDFNF